MYIYLHCLYVIHAYVCVRMTLCVCIVCVSVVLDCIVFVSS